MKRWFISIFLSAALAAPAIAPLAAQEDALKGLPGYVDFGELTGLFGEPTVQIAVGESLLGLVGALSSEDDPEAAALFKRLKGVRVHVFENTQVPDNAVDYVRRISSGLSERGWESVVTVNSQEEQVRIFMKINNAEVEGITVMALEENEAVFVNVIGNLNPAELERVMDNFDVDFSSSGKESSEE